MNTKSATEESSKCDKCHAKVNMHGGWNGVACFDCERVYVRCEAHGGNKGARRSLHSHRALMHPAAERMAETAARWRSAFPGVR